MKTPYLLFSTENYTSLARKLLSFRGIEPAEMERKTFPDGEKYMRILSGVAGRDVVLLGGTISERDTLELYDLACGLVKSGVDRLIIVIPYFGYSTMERAVKSGEIVTAKNRARLLSSIPPAAVSNTVVMIDLHSEGIPQYFEGGIVPVHLYAKPVILEAIKKLGADNPVLASTDAGRAKWVESLANDLGVDAAFVLKKRIDGSRTEVVASSGDVKERQVVIYDDMIRTGSSLLRAAETYRKAGACGVSAVATHGIFPGNSLEKLQNSGLIDQLMVTDTHPNAENLASGGFLEVTSIAGLIIDFLSD